MEDLQYYIFLVDDDRMLLDSLRNELKLLFKDKKTFPEDYKFHYSLHLSTTTARKELEELITKKTRIIVLILCDWMMMPENGEIFLRDINTRYEYKDIVKLLVTGRAPIDTKQSLMKDGIIYNYIEKPWKHETLKEHIKNAIEYFFIKFD